MNSPLDKDASSANNDDANRELRSADAASPNTLAPNRADEQRRSADSSLVAGADSPTPTPAAVCDPHVRVRCQRPGRSCEYEENYPPDYTIPSYCPYCGYPLAVRRVGADGVERLVADPRRCGDGSEGESGV